MPSPRYITEPQDQEGPNPLGGLLAGFLKKANESRTQERESDALKEIYSQYQGDGENLQKQLQAIGTDSRIGPTRRVNEVNQILKMAEYNEGRTKRAKEDYEKKLKGEQEDKQLTQLEIDRKLPPGSLSNYKGNVALADKASKPQNSSRVNQADREIDPVQRERMQAVESLPEFKKASIPEKHRLLREGLVSKENANAVVDTFTESSKIENKHNLDVHKLTKDYDEEVEKAAKNAKKQMDAIKETRQSVNSGNSSPWSLANVFKGTGTVGDKISAALTNKDQATISALVPEFLEGRKELFGVRLSDADLKLLQDKLPDIGKNKDANNAILDLMERYGEMSILRGDIAAKIKKASGGYRGISYQNEVEEEFDKMMQPVRIRDPKTKKIFRVPLYKSGDAIKSGGEIVNEL